MTHTSEWVSPGHPDKLADFITSYILDRHLERDPLARYAVECLVKDNRVVLAGEVSSSAGFSDSELADFARAAVRQVGYTRDYASRWGKGDTICADDLEVEVLIGRQSPDIAAGVNGGGWGDQGIFWGMATSTGSFDHLPVDYWLARDIGRRIVKSGVGGIDVKTLVSVGDDGHVEEIFAAVPLLGEDTAPVRALIYDSLPPSHAAKVIVNGAGMFRAHGPVADCGVTGRKLAVDFYGGNCRVGGGSPWGKDASKADVTLNVHARHVALTALGGLKVPTAYAALSCCIGRPEVRVRLLGADHAELDSWTIDLPPEEVIAMHGLREPNFARRCANGLFV